jgi:hypothetical protein
MPETKYYDREPRGWGNQPWGQKHAGGVNDDKEYRTKGWGDKKTRYQTEGDDQ